MAAILRLALLLPSLAAADVTPLHGRNFQERILAQHEQMSCVAPATSHTDPTVCTLHS